MHMHPKHLTALFLCALLLLNTAFPALADADPLIAPDESFIIECLKTIPEVSAIGAATKNNDPNGSLNKVGWYTAAVFFSTSLLNPDAASMTADEVLDAGTTGGGCLEVYRTVEDANYRRNNLKLAGGKEVLGTIVIRLSGKLSDADSSMLMEKILTALKTRAYGSPNQTPPSATSAPTTVNDTLANVKNYLLNHYYFGLVMNLYSAGAKQSAIYDLVGKPTTAVTIPTDDGNGYYVFEYYVTGADEIHISRVTFVDTFADAETAGNTLVALAMTLRVLPSNSTEQINRFLQILNLGQSYVNGSCTVNVMSADLNGSCMICAVFDGLDK